MENYREVLNQYPALPIIHELLGQLDMEGYVVGGFVRDLLLKRPSKDIDIVCVGDSIALAEAFAARIQSSQVSIFRNFGTAMVRHKEWEIEFVGARKESYQRHSRKPAVEAGTLADDQYRRDFTVNALAIGLTKEKYGQLIDPFNGMLDLHDHILRTPLAPDKTFSDDPLRMMRAVRFACQLSFELAPDVYEALKKEADRLTIVSMERIMGEFNKILCSPDPAHGLLLLDETGLLDHILPELQALKGKETIQGQSHKDNFLHTLQVLRNVCAMSDNLWLRWAALLHDIAKPQTKRFDPRVGFTFHGHEELGARMVPAIFRRLRLPLQQSMRYVKKLVRLHLRPIALAQDIVTDSAVRRLMHEAGDEIDDLIILCRADITSKNHRKVRTYLHNFEKVEAKIAHVKEKDFVRTLQPVIDGDEIMKTFGIGPSKEVGIIKKALKEAVLDGTIPNQKPDLYTYMLIIAKKIGLQPTND